MAAEAVARAAAAVVEMEEETRSRPMQEAPVMPEMRARPMQKGPVVQKMRARPMREAPVVLGIRAYPTRIVPVLPEMRACPTQARPRDWATRVATAIWARLLQTGQSCPSPCSASPCCCGACAGIDCEWVSWRLSSCSPRVPNPVLAKTLGLSPPVRRWEPCPRRNLPPGPASTFPRRQVLPRATCSRLPLTRPARCWSCSEDSRASASTPTQRRCRICGSGIPRPAAGPTAPLQATSRPRARARAWFSIRLATSSSSLVGVRQPTSISLTPGNGILLLAPSPIAPNPAWRRSAAVSTAWCSRNPPARSCSLAAASSPPTGTTESASCSRLAKPGSGIPLRVRGFNLRPLPRPVRDMTPPWSGTASAPALSCSAGCRKSRLPRVASR